MLPADLRISRARSFDLPQFQPFRYSNSRIAWSLPLAILHSPSQEQNNVQSPFGSRPAAFSNDANFSGLHNGRDPLHIDAVSHKAFIEVNEEGAEAAAATAVTMALPIAAPPLTPPPPIPVFRADHPFLFAICDVQTGLMLFLGRVVNP